MPRSTKRVDDEDKENAPGVIYGDDRRMSRSMVQPKRAGDDKENAPNARLAARVVLGRRGRGGAGRGLRERHSASSAETRAQQRALEPIKEDNAVSARSRLQGPIASSASRDAGLELASAGPEEQVLRKLAVMTHSRLQGPIVSSASSDPRVKAEEVATVSETEMLSTADDFFAAGRFVTAGSSPSDIVSVATYIVSVATFKI